LNCIRYRLEEPASQRSLVCTDLLVHNRSLNEAIHLPINTLYEKIFDLKSIPLSGEAEAKYTCATILDCGIIGIVDGSKRLLIHG
jgi:hypothetical protein